VKKTLSTFALMALMSAVGCNNLKTDTPSAINDINPPSATPTAYQPTSAAAPSYTSNTAATVTPVADMSAAPVIADTAPVSSKSKHSLKTASVKDTHAKSESTGKKYTIKKGDNLTKIAKLEYGKNGDYKKILAANPGLNPDKLMVGKTIVIPQ